MIQTCQLTVIEHPSRHSKRNNNNEEEKINDVDDVNSWDKELFPPEDEETEQVEAGPPEFLHELDASNEEEAGEVIEYDVVCCI